MEDVLKKKIITFCAAVLFLTALGLTLYPLISNYVNHKYASEIQTAYQELIQQTDDSVLQEAKQRAVTYNLAIIPGTADAYSEEALVTAAEDYNSQSTLSEAGAYQAALFTLTGYGLPDETFGVISIPKLDLEMPLYLGATDENMAKGAAVLSGTSIPIGGSNTNAVIAGHRGWGGAAYFRYITDLAVGDEVIITNLWERLRYRVVGTKIIEPHEIEDILIQPGRDMVTLLTCHPYASGGKQRYLVYCQRIPEYDIMEVPYD